MSKIINGVASEYDIPMKYENKTTTVFIDTQDMEERYGEELYKEYLEKENQQLKEKINTYENPEDLTLMFMYCDEKAKDKIKELKEIEKEHQKINGELREEMDSVDDYNRTLRRQNKQLKEVIEEVREYVKENRLYNYKYDEEELFEIITDEKVKEDLLQILDKGVKDE